MIQKKVQGLLTLGVRTGARFLMASVLACLLVVGWFPLYAYAEDERLESPTDPEGIMPILALPSISSPELLKGLIDRNDPSLNGSSSHKSFDYEGTYDGHFVVSDDYEQLFSVSRDTVVPNTVVALVKDKGTLLLADCMLLKRGDATDVIEAISYGTNAVITALGQSALALVINCNLKSDALGAPGLSAQNNAIILAQNTLIEAAHDYSDALQAAYGGTILANEITADLLGANSAATSAGAGGGSISIANSTLNTDNINSPLASSDGRIEMDNVSGTAAASQLAWVRDSGALLVHGCNLESDMTDRDTDDPNANAVTFYREDPVNLETLQEYALFQATDSALSSSLETGSFFYLTNTRAHIYLSNTTLDFDENAVRLLTATGNNRNSWGTQGANGASATLTAYDQKLKGDIIVDSQSFVDFFLLEGSTWRGGALNFSGSQTMLTSDKLNVTIDRNSTWIVTKKSTVTTLNLAHGARLVDPQGKSVKIVDSNGFTLVDGASKISVTVTGGFSTSVKTTADNNPEDYSIDRALFDETFGLDTAYGSNASSVYSAEELRTREVASLLRSWFREL